MIPTNELVADLSEQVRQREVELMMVEAENEALCALVGHLRCCSGCRSIEWCAEAIALWESAGGH